MDGTASEVDDVAVPREVFRVKIVHNNGIKICGEKSVKIRSQKKGVRAFVVASFLRFPGLCGRKCILMMKGEFELGGG